MEQLPQNPAEPQASAPAAKFTWWRRPRILLSITFGVTLLSAALAGWFIMQSYSNQLDAQSHLNESYVKSLMIDSSGLHVTVDVEQDGVSGVVEIIGASNLHKGNYLIKFHVDAGPVQVTLSGRAYADYDKKVWFLRLDDPTLLAQMFAAQLDYDPYDLQTVAAELDGKWIKINEAALTAVAPGSEKAFGCVNAYFTARITPAQADTLRQTLARHPLYIPTKELAAEEVNKDLSRHYEISASEEHTAAVNAELDKFESMKAMNSVCAEAAKMFATPASPVDTAVTPTLAPIVDMWVSKAHGTATRLKLTLEQDGMRMVVTQENDFSKEPTLDAPDAADVIDLRQVVDYLEGKAPALSSKVY